MEIKGIKINSDFLFSENSCANWYHSKLLFQFTDEVIKPYPKIIYFLSPFLVVLFEIIESIFLMFKKTDHYKEYFWDVIRKRKAWTKRH